DQLNLFYKVNGLFSNRLLMPGAGNFTAVRLCQPMLSLTVVTAGAALEQHTLAKLVMQFGGCGGVLNISPGRRRQPELINEGFLGFAIRQPTKNGAVNKAGVLG